MKYICKKHKELGFYVGGELKRFHDGVYATDNKKEIAVLESLIDTEKVEESTEDSVEDTKGDTKGSTVGGK